jgi:hypothetical protein
MMEVIEEFRSLNLSQEGMKGHATNRKERIRSLKNTLWLCY